MANNEEIVLEELFLKPTYRFHLRELARETKIHPNTLIRITDELQRRKLIKKEAIKHRMEISLNLDNPEIIWRKKLYNLNKIYSSGMIEFLAKEYSPVSISVIGSYSRGEDIESSDVDIVVIAGKKNIMGMDKYEKIIGRKIHLILSERSKLSEEFFNNLISGICIYGVIKT